MQPVTYFIVLSSILVHGLTISFFTLGRRVHSRVASISRTFTQNSRSDTQYAEEPSWMSRVKRAQNREDIVINRDDDDTEKTGTAAESGDIGKLAMFGAPSAPLSEPSTGSETAGSSEKDLEKGSPEASGDDNIDEEDEDVLRERPTLANRKSRTRVSMRRERDDDPPKNVLAQDENEEEVEEHTHEHHPHHIKPEDGGAAMPRPKSKTRESASDARYCAANQTQTWQEGRHVSSSH